MLLSELSDAGLDAWHREPIHPVLLQLGRAALERECLRTPEFKKLVAYLLEVADGRDRREAWAPQQGFARPVPKLRGVLEDCYGTYVDLEWFRLNRTANASRLPLLGLFPRMAAMMSRVAPDDFGEIVEGLIAPTPDAAVVRRLHHRKGKIAGMGLGLFSRVAFAFRRDLYFVIPKAWGETSGCLKYIGSDLRRYCAVCRALRAVCNDMGISESIRGTVLLHALADDPVDPVLRAALDEAMGGDLARFQILGPQDAYEPDDPDEAALPLVFAARAIRARRGERSLRRELIRLYGGRCAITGTGPVDLLEVGYVAPFPAGDVHAPDNAVLLRSDIHTLWDLNLIAIDPGTLTVRVSDRLKSTPYEGLADSKIRPRDGDESQFSRQALRDRFDAFAREEKKGSHRSLRPIEVSTQRPGDDAFSRQSDGADAAPPADEPPRPVEPDRGTSLSAS